MAKKATRSKPTKKKLASKTPNKKAPAKKSSAPSQAKRPIMQEANCPMIAIPPRSIPKAIEHFVSENPSLTNRLDLSPRSVIELEKEIKMLRKQPAPRNEDEVQGLMDDLTWLGYYFGETIRRNVGGKWVKCPELGVPAALDFKADATWNPIGKVLKCYDDAKMDSVTAMYEFLSHRHPPR